MNQKNKKNICKLLILTVLLSLIGMASTVSAESMVEAGTISMQWVVAILILGAILIVIPLIIFKGSNGSLVFVIIGVVMIAFSGIAYFDWGVEGEAPETGEITENASWEVTINSAGTDSNFNDNDNTFISMVYVNKSSGTILDSGNSTFTDPVFNLTVSPESTVGISTTQQQATGALIVNWPSYSFSDADATDTLYLFSKASSGKFDVTWTADGVNREEEGAVTVTFGNSEYVILEPEYRDSAIKYLDTGDTLSWTFEVCGETYTATITVVNAWGSV